MKNSIKSALFLFVIVFAAIFAEAQIAGNPPYTLEQSVIASGGGVSSSTTGDMFSITGTIGQTVAGTTSTNSSFILRSGFFTPEFVPTAAAVSIQGRVRMANGKGIRNVEITLTEADGTTRTTLSGISGKYSFADVAAGQTIILDASARRFSFSQSSQVLNLTEELSGIDFIALEQWVSSR